MNSDLPSPSAPPVDSRRRRILDAAVGVFSRLGYRKASMDEVARVAQVSRQGLYLHFSTKEDLFREAVKDYLRNARTRAAEALADSERPLEERVVQAFDIWLGAAIERRGAEMEEMFATTRALLGDMVDECASVFFLIVRDAIDAESATGRVGSDDIARTLNAAAIGFKHICKTRAEFREAMSAAVRLAFLSFDKAG